MHAVPGLACPACRGDLRADGEVTLTCQGCGSVFPILDGIPSFVAPTPTLPERLKRSLGTKAPLAWADGPGERGRERPDLTVVIPAAKQASDLDRLLPALRHELSSLEISHELLVVDQSSGYGAALRTGFDQALGDYVLTLDADGSHDPSFLRAIWAARTGVDVVIASRYVEGGGAEMPRTRQALSRTLSLVLRRGLSLPYSDLSSGYRLYRRAALESVALQATGFDILQEVLIRMLAAGYTIREVPLRYRAVGTSRAWLARFALSHVKTFLAMWKLRNSIASADYDARAYESVVPLQRYWQRRRYQVITTMAAGTRRLLDVGCGSSRIIGAGPMVGLDIVLAKLRYARRYGNPLVHGSIFELPFKDSAFDCVICSEVIEHVPADERVFSELERVLEPGGRLILGTPDYDRWRWRALEALYGRLSPGGYADEHITHYSRSNLAAYLVARGFTIDKVEYVGGSEMIFALRKSSGVPAATPLPVAAGLRSR
jgi:dolichol-phosphate mannosyltransferase